LRKLFTISAKEVLDTGVLPATCLIMTSVGMGFRRYLPVAADRLAATLRNLSLAAVAFLVIYVFATQGVLVAAEWRTTAAAGPLFIVLALLCGLSLGRVLRMPEGDVATAGIVFAVRNVGLATAIAVTLLHRSEYAVFAVVYFLTEVPFLLGFVTACRCWRRLRGSMGGHDPSVPVSDAYRQPVPAAGRIRCSDDDSAGYGQRT